MNFNELNINENIKNALKKKGFVNPSEIQEKVIPEALLGKDIVGKAKTGTGKTSAFAIPIIEKTIPHKGISALIVVPTRELALQVKEEFSSVAIGSRIKCLAVFGGQRVNRQLELLHAKPEIIVGTPGRLLDLLSRNSLNLSTLKFLVLDEADIMFDMGFRKDVEEIMSYTPQEKQTMLFSATFSEEILSIVNTYLKHNKIIFDLSEDNSPVEEVEQFYLMVNKSRKIDSLQSILVNDNSKTLVFCRTKRTVDWLERQLSRRNINALSIHGDKPQNARIKIIDHFKRSNDAILIATDIVARGIHVDNIGNVINFDFPEETETYIHRIGRTARQGKNGRAISFCTNLMELQMLKKVASRNNTEIHEIEY
ncbi:MAG: DEAD/DEAH box helicase, partial [Candidatus Diapherotrites archaeon]|nr:DEAD/DEAH box helicase [Candidatus Diapherotrites archaeon]